LELPGIEQTECNSELKNYCSRESARHFIFIRDFVKSGNNGTHSGELEV
jgi:hypothetical protein